MKDIFVIIRRRDGSEYKQLMEVKTTPQDACKWLQNMWGKNYKVIKWYWAN